MEKKASPRETPSCERCEDVRYRVVRTGLGGSQLTEIFEDGDACPVKDETDDVAIRYGVRVSLVANTRRAASGAARSSREGTTGSGG